MSIRPGAKLVTTPAGTQWQVSRRWLTRSITGTLAERGRSIRRSGFEQFDGPGDASDGSFLALYVGVVVLLLLLPLILFGVELIILGWVLAAGLVARVVFRRPWVIVAKTSHPVAGDRVLEWRVCGWRASRRQIDRVAEDLAAGREPSIG